MASLGCAALLFLHLEYSDSGYPVRYSLLIYLTSEPWFTFSKLVHILLGHPVCIVCKKPSNDSFSIQSC